MRPSSEEAGGKQVGISCIEHTNSVLMPTF